MPRRDAGASAPQIAEATGWASHTVRGFLAGLKKKGFTIATLERVRTVILEGRLVKKDKPFSD